MHLYYALNRYAISKFGGFGTFIVTLIRSFVKCILGNSKILYKK